VVVVLMPVAVINGRMLTSMKRPASRPMEDPTHSDPLASVVTSCRRVVVHAKGSSVLFVPW
jgi:hypothetical protein